MAFKSGDKVRVCMGCGTGLVNGNRYLVERADERYVYLAGVVGGWRHSRFESVTETPTARSNDPFTSKGKRKVNKYEEEVLAQLSIVGPSTGKEIASLSQQPLNCITPRFAPLRRKGLIKDSGIKRDKQIVWVLA